MSSQGHQSLLEEIDEKINSLEEIDEINKFASFTGLASTVELH